LILTFGLFLQNLNKYETSMEPRLPTKVMFICELERSGIELAKSVKRDPRCELNKVKSQQRIPYR